MNLRILPGKSTRPRRDVGGGVYSLRRERRRGLKSNGHADDGKARQHFATSAQSPLRPSEGLDKAFPRVLRPGQGSPTSGARRPGNAGAEGFFESRGCQGRLVLATHSKGQANTSREARSQREGVAPVNLPAAPPVNQAAEQSVLGTLVTFYTPTLVGIVSQQGVKWNDFYYREHQVIYRAVLKLHADGTSVDAITVRDLLARHQLVGDKTDAVLGMLAVFARPSALRDHARIVAEDGRWRRWLSSTLEALEHIYDRDDTAFWAAISRVRDDVLPGELKLVSDGEAAA